MAKSTDNNITIPLDKKVEIGVNAEMGILTVDGKLVPCSTYKDVHKALDAALGLEKPPPKPRKKKDAPEAPEGEKDAA